ncbi:MAG: ABC transporter permease [Mycoplasma sp.]
MNKILKNMYKGIFSHKTQLIALIVLVCIGVSFAIGVSSSIQVISKKYDEMVKESTPHQFIMDISNLSDVSDENDKNHQIHDESHLLKNIETYLNPFFTSSNVQEQYTVKDIHELYTGSVPGDKGANSVFKVEPYQAVGVDKTIIVKTMIDPSKMQADEIYISPFYAQARHINLGDSITVGQDKPYKVVGYAVSYDFLFMQVDKLNQIPDGQNEAMVYCSPNAFYYNPTDLADGSRFATTSSQDREIYIMGATNQKNFDFRNFLQNKIKNPAFNNSTGILNVTGSGFNYSFNIYNGNDPKFLFNNRSNTFGNIIDDTKSIMIVLMIILTIVTWFIITIISKKRLDQDSQHIGIFIANGYRKLEIILSYVGYSFISTIVSSVLAIFVSIGVYYFITQLFLSLFNLPIFGTPWDFGEIAIYSVISAIIAIIITCSITFLFLWFKLRNVTTIELVKREV